jgi:hypothetical protein
MSEMLRSIRADLTSRRMLPLVLLAAGLLIGAIAYTALSGKASSEPVASGPGVQAPSVPGPAVSTAPGNPNAAVAETTNGGRYQHHGHVRNPFAPLPSGKSSEGGTPSASRNGSEAAANAGSVGGEGTNESEGGGASSSPGGSPGGGEGAASGGEGESSPSGESPGEASHLPPVSYFLVTATLKQQAEAGQPETFAGLDSLKVLPSKHAELFAYAGVQDAGHGALFVLVAPAIVSGEGRCLPSKASCESIYLKPKQSEELQYLKSGGSVVTFILKVSRIAKQTMPAAEAKAKASAAAGRQREELELLGVSLPPKVSFSPSVPGMLDGLDAALEASRKAEGSAKASAPAGTGESSSGQAQPGSPSTSAPAVG